MCVKKEKNACVGVCSAPTHEEKRAEPGRAAALSSAHMNICFRFRCAAPEEACIMFYVQYSGDIMVALLYLPGRHNNNNNKNRQQAETTVP